MLETEMVWEECGITSIRDNLASTRSRGRSIERVVGRGKMNRFRLIETSQIEII